MNFLSATNEGQGRWRAGGAVFDGPVSDRPTLELAIRPEDIEVGAGEMETAIRLLEPLGPHTLADCRVDGAPFRVVIDSDLPVRIGDTLRLRPLPDRIRWFDPETALAA